jgi:nitroreductase
MFGLLSRVRTLSGTAPPAAAAASSSSDAPAVAAAAAPSSPSPAAVAASASPSSSAAAIQACITTRRAVYPKDMQRGAVVPREKLEKMLECARWAPTHKLTQPWRFVVLGGVAKDEFERLSIDLVERRVQDKEKREATLKKMRRKQENDWRNVAAYVAIVLRRTQGASAPPEWEEAASVAMAVQNLWLSGWELGVHGYWSSWQVPARDAPEMGAFLGADLAAGDKVLGFFVAGVADPERLAGYRGSRRPLDEVVEWRMD